MTVFVLVALMVVPFFIWFKWRQFFGGDPRYDIRVQRAREEEIAVVPISNPNETEKNDKVLELMEISEEPANDYGKKALE